MEGDAPPDVKAIPAMLRRRLSPLGKMALSTAIPLLKETDSGVPTVLVSRHGDLHRTVNLLQDLAAGESLSPTHFSLSVHNAIGGLLSIARKDTSSMTALACGFDDISTALLEAQAILTEQDCKQVLCLIYDEPLPALYQQQQPALPDHAYAVAFLLGTPSPLDTSSSHTSAEPEMSVLQSEMPVQLDLCRRDTSESSAEASRPQALSLLRWLITTPRTAPLTLTGSRNSWRWSSC